MTHTIRLPYWEVRGAVDPYERVEQAKKEALAGLGPRPPDGRYEKDTVVSRRDDEGCYWVIAYWRGLPR